MSHFQKAIFCTIFKVKVGEIMGICYFTRYGVRANESPLMPYWMKLDFLFASFLFHFIDKQLIMI